MIAALIFSSLVTLAAFLLLYFAEDRAKRAREDAREAQQRAHIAEINEKAFADAAERWMTLHNRLLAKNNRRRVSGTTESRETGNG